MKFDVKLIDYPQVIIDSSTDFFSILHSFLSWQQQPSWRDCVCIGRGNELLNYDSKCMRTNFRLLRNITGYPAHNIRAQFGKDRNESHWIKHCLSPHQSRVRLSLWKLKVELMRTANWFASTLIQSMASTENAPPWIQCHVMKPAWVPYLLSIR